MPRIRLQACNQAPIHSGADYVLYWMIASRRLRYNFALDRALEWCRELSKPLVILEALRRDFPRAGDRIRRFVIDGMWANGKEIGVSSVFYYPFVESRRDQGKGLLSALAARAAVVITDEFPCFFLPAMVHAAGKKLPVLLEQVDSNGLLPLRAAPNEFSTAYAFRRFLQKQLPDHLLQFPNANPFSGAALLRAEPLPKKITNRWPALDRSTAAQTENREFHVQGGSGAAKQQLETFLRHRLESYSTERNDPSADGTSGLSPYLHFGHISSHEIFSAVTKQEKWKPERLALRANGSRAGWWGMSPSGESFLDQLITWRELGFNTCHRRKDYDRFESLPPWAQKTLTDHAGDARPVTYTIEEFAAARTHDGLWNAAQIQLVREGRIHSYLRMLWGKKILEWTRSPQEALRVMIELNNRYALDGRDPNSYSGIFWCLGRYDRPWGPVRPIFGTVRYMSSANTTRKLNVKPYLEKYEQSRPENNSEEVRVMRRRSKGRSAHLSSRRP